ncbi:MAG: phosphotransferase, partial [Acidimicrobiales bacterium]
MADSGVTLTEEALPEGVADLLAGYLGRQRWFARPAGAGGHQEGREDVAPEEVVVQRSARLLTTAGGSHRLWWAVVAHADARYQLLLGERPGGEPAEFLGGHEASVIGTCGDSYFYDGTLDTELALPFLELISGGEQTAERVRPIGVEQSNTSLVYDDRVILKVFRRLLEGRNPDVEVTTALARAGFEQVATPVALWHHEGTDLAFAQEFLAGGSEGWALALTSLRDLYNSGAADPAETGGDFSGEATRLGSMTARMHLALADSFGTDAGRLSAGGFGELVDDIERRLEGLGPEVLGQEVGKDVRDQVRAALARLRAVADAGPALRVHGDYHLGQVMRTDGG